MKYTRNTFAALKISAYQIYFGAILMQMAAMNMQMVTRSWFMYELTDSAVMLGTVGLCSALPIITVSLYGGVLADRIRKRGILIAGQFTSALVAFGIAFSITMGTISWVHLFIAAFFQGLVMALMMPARQAIIYELVGENTLMNAIALNAAAMNIIRLTAPAITGFLIALWDIEAVYYIMTILYVIGFVFSFRLPLTGEVQLRKAETMQELKEGLRYIWNNSNILAILFLTLMANILSSPHIFLLPIFAKDVFSVNISVFGKLTSLPLIGSLFLALSESSARQGLLISFSAIGALVGSFAVASMKIRMRGLIFLLSLLLTAISLICFTATSSYLLALIIFVPLGLGHACRMTLSNTLLQSNTDDVHRGRVMSVYMMNMGVTMVGVFIVSTVADIIGVQLAVGGAAGILGVLALYYLFFAHQIRHLD